MEDNEIKYSEEIEEVINKPNTECRLYASPECELLNMGVCSECPVGNLKPDKQEKAKAALSRLLAAAPAYKVEPLYNSNHCMLSWEHEKADCFAMFDLKKEDPEGDWTIALGNRKVSVKGADMILPLTVACSKKCRSAYRAFEYIPTLIALIIAGAFLAVVTLPAVHDKLYAIAAFMPLVAMLWGVVLAFAAYLVFTILFKKRLKKQMRTDVADIPEVRELMENGFTEVNEKKFGVSRMVFADKRRENGVYSRITQEPEDYNDPRLHVCGIWPAEVPENSGEGEE